MGACLGLIVAAQSGFGSDPDRGLFGRYSRSEIRMVRQIRVAELQEQVDRLAREQRVLDVELQQHNWTTPLIE